MLRRLLYHYFWNFYDYLGTYFFTGVLITGALFIFAWLASILAAVPMPLAVQIIVALVLLAIFIVLLSAVLSGIYNFAWRAAIDEPARWPDLKQGWHLHLKRYVKLVLLIALAIAVLASNLVVYRQMAASATSMKSMLLVISMVFFWFSAVFVVYAHVVVVSPVAFADEPKLLGLLKKSFLVFALAPMFWVLVALANAIIVALCIASVIGIFFIIPCLAALTTTALRIVRQHVDFLTEARVALGEGHSVAEYKRKATELAWEWEHRQPRRTLRELIKPWEM